MITLVRTAVLLSACLVVGADSAFAADIAVVVNKDNPVTVLSAQDVRRLYQGRQKLWDSGAQVVLLLPPLDSAALDALSKRILAVRGPGAVASYYLRAIFEGRLVAMPTRTEGPADAVAKVGRHRGAIVLLDRLHIPRGGAVRIIDVDGL